MLGDVVLGVREVVSEYEGVTIIWESDGREGGRARKEQIRGRTPSRVGRPEEVGGYYTRAQIDLDRAFSWGVDEKVEAVVVVVAEEEEQDGRTEAWRDLEGTRRGREGLRCCCAEVVSGPGARGRWAQQRRRGGVWASPGPFRSSRSPFMAFLHHWLALAGAAGW